MVFFSPGIGSTIPFFFFFLFFFFCCYGAKKTITHTESFAEGLPLFRSTRAKTDSPQVSPRDQAVVLARWWFVGDPPDILFVTPGSPWARPRCHPRIGVDGKPGTTTCSPGCVSRWTAGRSAHGTFLPAHPWLFFLLRFVRSHCRVRPVSCRGVIAAIIGLLRRGSGFGKN